MGRVCVRVRGAVVRCYDDNLGAGLSDPVDLSHGLQNVRMVLEEVREVDLARAIVLYRPGEMPEVAEHVGR